MAGGCDPKLMNNIGALPGEFAAMMDTGSPADSEGVEESLFNPSSSDRGEASSTLIDPVQPDKPVTPPGISTTCNLGGNAATPSSGSTASSGGETHAEEKPRPGVIGGQGITKFEFGHLIAIVDEGREFIEGVRVVKEVFVDSFPSKDDEWWIPPLHGEDVASLSDNFIEELDEQRHDYTQFTRILEAHGCQSSSVEEDFLLCFQNERELQHSETGRDNLQGTEGSQTPQQAGFVTPVKLSASFHLNRDEGRICRPSAEELERCLIRIPDEPHGEWKYRFKSLTDEAVGAVKHLDWKMACKQFEASLLVLEKVESSIGFHIETWLLLWVSIPLVEMYQLRLGNYPRCVTIYDQVLQKLNRAMDSPSSRDQKRKTKVGEEADDEHEALVLLYYSIIWHRRLVLFEWSYTCEKEGNQLLAKYVRSKVFTKIRKIHPAGFTQIQRMVNYWGRRTDQGSEGDMRVALCFNLEHLYRASKQHLRAIEWTREKWRWIRDETHKPEDQWNLKLEDVRSLSNAGMKQEFQSRIDDLEGIKSTLPTFVSDSIDHSKAEFLMKSDRPKEAEEMLQKLRKRLEKRRGTTNDQRSAAKEAQLLADVKFDLSILNFQPRLAEMFQNTPYKVEMTDASDRAALSLMEEYKLVNSSKILETLPGYDLTHGVQLLISLGKRFPPDEIETYRERLHDAVESFEQTLHSISKREEALRFKDQVTYHEEIVDTHRRISRDRITCHESLGICCVYGHQLKPRGEKYNVEDLENELPVYDEACLDKGIEHFKKSLDLAEKLNERDGAHFIPRITARLGWIHFYKVKGYLHRMLEFAGLAPKFYSQYEALDEESRIETSMGSRELAVRPDHGHPRGHDHVYALVLGTNVLGYYHKQKALGDPVYAFKERLNLFGYREKFGLSEGYLTDEDFWRTVRYFIAFLELGLMLEIKRSSDYIQRGLEMGYGRIRPSEMECQYGCGGWALHLTRPSSNEEHLVPGCEVVETTKKYFTLFQQLMAYEQMVRKLITNDRLLQALVAYDPRIAEYSRSQPDDLTPSQKALLWAERGRSRSLMHQLLANKQPEEPINNMVNFDMTDQEAWAVLRATQSSCGENTVFVAYTFDATYEFQNEYRTGKSDDDWKSCNWIVYIVTKEGEVHMRSEKSRVPENFVKHIHNDLSKGERAEMVEKSLEDLYDAFIRPISDLLRDMKPEDKLVFALDEVLTNVPFAILRDSKTGKYLFENHTISFTPALRVLVHCDQRHISLQASPTVVPSVAFGDPAYPPKGPIRRIPHTYHEVMNIPPLFSDGCVKILTGTEATADNLLTLAKLPVDTVQGFVHVAAHGFVDKDHKSGSLQLAYSRVLQDPPLPDLSSRRADDYDEPMELEESTLHNMTDDFQTVEEGIAVRDGQPRAWRKATAEEAMAKENACLRSEKIMECGFEWRSFMVVLSACNSAKGFVLGSEGVVGLPRAFLVAGVPCIIASQWSLEDKSSSELMREFYKEMSQGRDASSALRAAMLRQMQQDLGSSEQQVDVYKWGGYLVWGSPTVTVPPSMLNIDERHPPR